MTQTALAQAADVPQGQLSSWENGIALAPWSALERIAKQLAVTPADLYSDDILRALRAAAEVA